MSTLGVATGTSSNSERSERDEAQPSGRADAPVRAFYLASVSPARRLPSTLGFCLQSRDNVPIAHEEA